jgi:peroxiredoxin (alkyl hydroperoxide reductase subunit C)
MPRFDALNTIVLAISTDSIYCTKIMLQTSPSGRGVNFPILSDRALRVSRQYGILNENEGFAYRASFIIDPEGRVQWSIVNPQPVGRSIEEILRVLAGLQYNRSTDMALPPDWQPGERGIPTGWDYVGKY